MKMSTSCQSPRRHLSPLVVLLIAVIGAEAASIPQNTQTDDGIDAPLVFPTVGSEPNSLGFLTPLDSEHSKLLRLSTGNRSAIIPASSDLSNIDVGRLKQLLTKFQMETSPSEEEDKAVSESVDTSLDKLPIVVETKGEETKKDSMPKTQKQTQSPDKSEGQENLQDKHWEHDHLSGSRGPLPSMRTPEATFLVAAMFVAVALFGYFGLVCWRRSLEKKYGNRELLVNEEEVNDMGDYKNSEIIGRSSKNGCT